MILSQYISILTSGMWPIVAQTFDVWPYLAVRLIPKKERDLFFVSLFGFGKELFTIVVYLVFLSASRCTLLCILLRNMITIFIHLIVVKKMIIYFNEILLLLRGRMLHG